MFFELQAAKASKSVVVVPLASLRAQRDTEAAPLLTTVAGCTCPDNLLHTGPSPGPMALHLLYTSAGCHRDTGHAEADNHTHL